MTPLQNEIVNGPLATELAPFVATGDDIAVAAILNDKRFTGLKSRLISARGVLSDYPGGPMAAAAVLDKLEAATPAVPALRWAIGFLKGEGLDIGHPATQAMLDQLAQGGVITVLEADKMKSLGLVPMSRSELLLGHALKITDVAAAVRNDDGSPK